MVGFDTPLDVLHEFRTRLRQYVNENPREWKGGYVTCPSRTVLVLKKVDIDELIRSARKPSRVFTVWMSTLTI